MTLSGTQLNQFIFCIWKTFGVRSAKNDKYIIGLFSTKFDESCRIQGKLYCWFCKIFKASIKPYIKQILMLKQQFLLWFEFGIQFVGELLPAALNLLELSTTFSWKTDQKATRAMLLNHDWNRGSNSCKLRLESRLRTCYHHQSAINVLCG